MAPENRPSVSSITSLPRPAPLNRTETIASPWVILGLPRTGTSILSKLLGIDPHTRPLLQWEAAHPIPPTTLAEADVDPRIAQTAKELAALMKLNPPLRVMHPFGATLAEECVSVRRLLRPLRRAI